MVEVTDIVESNAIWLHSARKVSEAFRPPGSVNPDHTWSVVGLQSKDVILVERATCRGYGGTGCQGYIRLGSQRRDVTPCIPCERYEALPRGE